MAKKNARSKPAARTFTVADKLRILREADVCAPRGELPALLRREGLRQAHLSRWRRDRAAWEATARDLAAGGQAAR